MTIAEALRDAVQRLTRAGVPDAAWDAELLLRHALGRDRAALLASGGEALPAGPAARYAVFVAARAARQPLQHLTGTQSFWRHEFRVGPAVLIPRPETELLVEVALELLRPLDAPVVVDVGTGSGCIAASLAAERGDAIVHATDISRPALAVAASNLRRLGLEGRVALHEGDLLGPVAALGLRVDLVVSNPPYVDPAEHAALQPEVRDFEPRLALLDPGGAYGAYRRLAPQAASALRPGGRLAVEIGAGMQDGVMALLRAAGYETLETRRDLRGLPRVVVGGMPQA
jgi:release factor glutamine methyltransferase